MQQRLAEQQVEFFVSRLRSALVVTLSETMITEVWAVRYSGRDAIISTDSVDRRKGRARGRSTVP